MRVVGVGVLVAVVVLALAGAGLGMVRRSASAARARRAQERVRAALGGGRPEAAVAALAREVPELPAAEAGALVLAGRRAFSRQIIPVLVAALDHRSPEVSEDASRALTDLGAPGLRSVWQALDAGGPERPALAAFLLRHPDWLFQRLIEGYASTGEASVRHHERLWRQDGMRERLALLLGGSDAINALRATAISRILGPDGGRVA